MEKKKNQRNICPTRWHEISRISSPLHLDRSSQCGSFNGDHSLTPEINWYPPHFSTKHVPPPHCMCQQSIVASIEKHCNNLNDQLHKFLIGGRKLQIFIASFFFHLAQNFVLNRLVILLVTVLAQKRHFQKMTFLSQKQNKNRIRSNFMRIRVFLTKIGLNTLPNDLKPSPCRFGAHMRSNMIFLKNSIRRWKLTPRGSRYWVFTFLC